MGKLIVSLSPHAHGNESVEKNMYGVIIALVPAIIASLYFFGIGSAVVLLTSVAACVFFEWAITKYLLKEEPSLTDGSAIITGLLLGMNRARGRRHKPHLWYLLQRYLQRLQRGDSESLATGSTKSRRQS